MGNENITKKNARFQRRYLTGRITLDEWIAGIDQLAKIYSRAQKLAYLARIRQRLTKARGRNRKRAGEILAELTGENLPKRKRGRPKKTEHKCEYRCVICKMTPPRNRRDRSPSDLRALIKEAIQREHPEGRLRIKAWNTVDRLKTVDHRGKHWAQKREEARESPQYGSPAIQPIAATPAVWQDPDLYQTAFANEESREIFKSAYAMTAGSYIRVFQLPSGDRVYADQTLFPCAGETRSPVVTLVSEKPATGAILLIGKADSPNLIWFNPVTHKPCRPQKPAGWMPNPPTPSAPTGSPQASTPPAGSLLTDADRVAIAVWERRTKAELEKLGLWPVA